MESTTNEFVKIFKERLKYPIITVYGIFLIVYNWDILLTLFLSKTPIEYRIEYIKTLYDNPYYERLWVPFLKAVGVSLAAPLIMLLLEFLQKFINDPRQDIKDKKALKIWEAKAKIAHQEFIYNENKTGSKNIIEWEGKLDNLRKELVNQEEMLSYKLSTLQGDNNVMTVNNDELKEKNVHLQTTLESEIKTKENLLQVINDNNETINNFILAFSEYFALDKRTYNLMLGALENNTNFESAQKFLKSEKVNLPLDRIATILNYFVSWGMAETDGLGVFRLTPFGRKLILHELPF